MAMTRMIDKLTDAGGTIDRLYTVGLVIECVMVREEALDVARCNEVYFAAVVMSLVDSGYLADARPARDANGDLIGWIGDMRLTMEGARYLDENSRMGEVRRFLGRAFEGVLVAAVEATIATGF